MRILTISILLGSWSCGAAEPASALEVPLVLSGTLPTPTDTDLGYRVELDEIDIGIENLEFVSYGEQSELAFRAWSTVSGWLLPSAHAHPGHSQVGDILGELPGTYRLEMHQPTQVGTVSMLPGQYDAVNFTFAALEPSPGLPSDSGISLRIRGRAIRNSEEIPFDLLIDAPEERQLLGAEFNVNVDSQTIIEFQMTMNVDGASVFDGIDFASLATDGAVLAPTEPESNKEEQLLLRRRFLDHSPYLFVNGDN